MATKMKIGHGEHECRGGETNVEDAWVKREGLDEGLELLREAGTRSIWLYHVGGNSGETVRSGVRAVAAPSANSSGESEAGGNGGRRSPSKEEARHTQLSLRTSNVVKEAQEEARTAESSKQRSCREAVTLRGMIVETVDELGDDSRRVLSALHFGIHEGWGTVVMSRRDRVTHQERSFWDLDHRCRSHSVQNGSAFFRGANSPLHELLWGLNDRTELLHQLNQTLVSVTADMCSPSMMISSTAFLLFAFRQAYLAHPKSVTQAVTYDIVGPALPQALRVIQFPYCTLQGGLRAQDHPETLAAKCSEHNNPTLISARERALPEQNSEIIQELEGSYSLLCALPSQLRRHLLTLVPIAIRIVHQEQAGWILMNHTGFSEPHTE
ncbi:hypothetical protein C8R45DRAFT_947910 [Mycena sanguinolenta]|nr:hypothetical protein C8R45DRAFT_947910 [Mycena sanguinolenta]